MNNSQQPTNYNMGVVQSEHFDGVTALSCFYLHYLKTFESGERGNNTGLETHTQLGNKKPDPIIIKGKKKKNGILEGVDDCRSLQPRGEMEAK